MIPDKHFKDYYLRINFQLLSIALALVYLTACTSSKKAADEYRYFDKNLDTLNTLVTQMKEPLIHEGDLLNITIMSATLNQEQVEVFNMGKSAGQGGYLVDPSGSINMPVLGKLKVDGLSKSDLEKQLQQKLEPYVKNPVVTISFLNFRVLLLGEIESEGFQIIQNEKASVLDAIGQAGGLSDFGQRTNILLIRQLPGGKKEYARLNMNDARIFASPYFQLQQNDVIYVLPNDSKMIVYKRANNPLFRDLPAYMGLIASILAFVTLIITATNL